MHARSRLLAILERASWVVVVLRDAGQPCSRCRCRSVRPDEERELTPRTNGQRNQARNADETHREEKDFEALTGWTDGRPRTVWAERDVVGCRASTVELRSPKKKQRERDRNNIPAFFSSTDSVFQSFF